MISKTLKTLINHSLNKLYDYQCVNTYILSNDDVKFVNIDELFTSSTEPNLNLFTGGKSLHDGTFIDFTVGETIINEQLDTLIKQSVAEFNTNDKKYQIYLTNSSNRSVNVRNLNTIPLFLLKEKQTIKNNGKLAVDYEYGVDYSDFNVIPNLYESPYGVDYSDFNVIPNEHESPYHEITVNSGIPNKEPTKTFIIVNNNDEMKPYKKLTKLNNYVHATENYYYYDLNDVKSMLSTNVISIGGTDNNQRVYLYGTNVLFLIIYKYHNGGSGSDGPPSEDTGGGSYVEFTCNIIAIKLDDFDLNTADVNNPNFEISYTHEHIIRHLITKKYFLVDDIPFSEQKNVNFNIFKPNDDYLTLIGNTDTQMVYPLNKSPRLRERKELSNFGNINTNHVFNNEKYSFSSELLGYNVSSLYLLDLLKGKDKYVKLFFTTEDDLTFSIEHTNIDESVFSKDHLLYLKDVNIPADIVNSQGLEGKIITKIECQMFNDPNGSNSAPFYYPIKEINNLNIPISSQGVTFSYKV